MNAHGARVTLLRHAHAEWPDYEGSDFDRPLTTRGLHEATLAAKALAAAVPRPTLIIASPARRTRQTAEAVATAALPDSLPVEFVDELYNAPARTLERELRARAGAVHVLLVAHNPGITELARKLSGDAHRLPFEPAQWLQVEL